MKKGNNRTIIIIIITYIAMCIYFSIKGERIIIPPFIY